MIGYSDEDFLFATLREFQKSYGRSEKTTLHIENVGNHAWMNFSILLSSNHQKQQEAILFNSATEFFKRWTAGKDSRIKFDYQGNQTLINFSAILGNPGTPERKRPKSARKIQRDNQRAAAYNEARKKLFQNENESFSVSDVASSENQTEDPESQVTAPDDKEQVVSSTPSLSPEDSSRLSRAESLLSYAPTQGGNPQPENPSDKQATGSRLIFSPQYMEVVVPQTGCFRRKITCDPVSKQKSFVDDTLKITSPDGTTVQRQLSPKHSDFLQNLEKFKDTCLVTLMTPCSLLDNIMCDITKITPTDSNWRIDQPTPIPPLPPTARMELNRLYQDYEHLMNMGISNRELP